MNPVDVILLWLLVVLAFAAAIMRILLAHKQGTPQCLGWKIQEFIFPVLLLTAMVLYQTGTADIIFPAVMLGLVEEIVCSILRRKRREDDKKQK